MTNTRLSFRMGMLISLIALVAAMAIGVTAWRGGHRTAASSIEWHGMHIAGDSDLVLHSEDTTLLLRSASQSQFDTTGWVLFRWSPTSKASNFEYEESVCGVKPNCRASSDTSGRVAFDCVSFYHGSVKDGNFSSANRCRIRQTSIEARYGCFNLSCQRFRSLVQLAFASLNRDSLGAVQSR